MGLRVRLRADFGVSGFPAEVQTILRGLKKYGMMLTDNGADWYVGGAPDPRWDDDALHSLDQVKGSDFEVVDSRALLPGAFSVSLPATARSGRRRSTTTGPGRLRSHSHPTRASSSRARGRTSAAAACASPSPTISPTRRRARCGGTRPA